MKKFQLLCIIALSVVYQANTQIASCLQWENQANDALPVPKDSSYTNDAQNAKVELSWYQWDKEDPNDLNPLNAPGSLNDDFLIFEHGQQGGHQGILEYSFNNDVNNPSEQLVTVFSFDPPLKGFSSSLLDIDGTPSFTWDDGVEILVNGVIDTGKYTSIQSLTPSVTRDDESYMSGYEGIFKKSPSGSIDGNVLIELGDSLIHTLEIRYFSTDDANANPNSQFIGIADFCWTEYKISGSVFHDVNGLNDQEINGLKTNLDGLYATLLDAEGNVIKSTSISEEGDFEFQTAHTGELSIQLNTNDQNIYKGSAPESADLPNNYLFVGEGVGLMNAGDGSINGKTSFTIDSSDVTYVQFGVNLPPTANEKWEFEQPNPGNLFTVEVPAQSFSGTDELSNTISSIIITSLPINTTMIIVGGMPYTNVNFPIDGLEIATNSDGNLLETLLLDPRDGNITSIITYVTVDEAGSKSSPGLVGLPFSLPLPVEFLSFDAKLKGDNEVLLKWETASEINNEYFEVERSLNGLEFVPIQRIKGSNQVSGNIYNHIDKLSTLNTEGTVFYRIKQVDFDGLYSYSTTKEVELTSNNEFKIFPNPIGRGENLNIKGDYETIEIYHVNGQRVLSGVNKSSIDTQVLKKGTYLID